MDKAFRNELRLGLVHDHIDEAGEAVAQVTGLELELKDDGERGGIYYYYESEDWGWGLGFVEVTQNLVDGRWQYELRPELRILVRLYMTSPHVFDLGDWMTRFEAACPYSASPFAAVARPGTFTSRGLELAWGYTVRYDAAGAPEPGAPPLTCHLTFDLGLDLDAATRALEAHLGCAVEEARINGLRTLVSPRFGRLSLSAIEAGTRLEAKTTTSDLLLPGRLAHALAELDPAATPRFHDLSGELREPGRVERLRFGEI